MLSFTYYTIYESHLIRILIPPFEVLSRSKRDLFESFEFAHRCYEIKHLSFSPIQSHSAGKAICTLLI